MLSDRLKQRIEQATITIRTAARGPGRGFLVEGDLILTAAHCIDFSTDGSMPQGDFYLQIAETRLGNCVLTPYAIEPVADIALFGAPDNEEPAFDKNLELFESFCEATTPLRLCTEEFELFEPFPVYVFTHEGDWIRGNAKLCKLDGEILMIKFDRGIKGGTSGSPIVNAEGQVVGLISTAGGAVDLNDVGGYAGKEVRAPRPHQALPVWALHRILASHNEAEESSVNRTQLTR